MRKPDKGCRYSTRLSVYADGELSGKETDKIRAHLDQCDDCRKALESVYASNSLLLGIGDIEPSRNFEQSVWKQIEKIEEKSLRRFLSEMFFFGWRPYAAAAMTALVFIFSIAVYHKSITPGLRFQGLGPQDIAIAENLELLEEFEIVSQLELLENLDVIMGLKETS